MERFRVRPLTRTEREALAGKSEQRHRTALTRLRHRPPPEKLIASILEYVRSYELLGHPHVLEDLAKAAAGERDASRARQLHTARRSIRTTRITKDQLDRLERHVEENRKSRSRFSPREMRRKDAKLEEDFREAKQTRWPRRPM